MPPLASVTSIDRHGFQWVIDHRVSALDPFFVGLTYIGTAGIVWIALSLLLAWRTQRNVLPVGVLVAVCVWGADVATSAVKAFVARPRPYISLHHVHVLTSRPTSSSFPSGHATTAFAGAVVLSYLWPRAALAFTALATAIAFSRIYVGVHYPFDVISAGAVGASTSVIGIAVTRRFFPQVTRHFSPRRRTA